MPKNAQKYSEGDLVAIPVLGGEIMITALLARYVRGTGICLLYAFEPMPNKSPVSERAFVADKGVLYIMQATDMSLRSGRWPIIGRLNDFTRSDWPLPPFWYGPYFEQPPVAWSPKQYVKRTYNDWDGKLYIAEEPIEEEEARKLPRDGLYGCDAVEIALGCLVGKLGT